MFDQLSIFLPTGDVRHAVLIVGCILTLWAAGTDLTRFTISNRVSTALFVSGGVWLLLTGSGAPWLHIAAFGVVLLLGFSAFALGFFGAGDAKMLAALALWFGYPATIGFIVQTLTFGAILAFIWVLSRPLRLALMAVGLPIDPEPPAQIPYGLAIAAAAMIGFADLWTATGS